MKPSTHLVRLTLSILLMSIAVLGCSPTYGETATSNPDQVAYFSEVHFIVTVPDKTPETDSIYIDFLDEITGLAFNITRYQMAPVSSHTFEIRIPVQIGSVVKYRYSRRGSQSTSEFNAFQSPVRYRLVHVNGQIDINDSVSSWIDIPCECATGVLEGRATDKNGASAGNLLISVDGQLSFSQVDGSFRIEGLSPGTHNMVAMDVEGNYQPFQQGVVISENAVTPAQFSVNNMPNLVKITLIVDAPESTPAEAVIRLIGNHPDLGNTYGELNGGMSVVASRAPILSFFDTGKYSISLELPAGYDLRYKYSLGDGFWNAELNPTGGFFIRQLIVPSQDIVIKDTIANWGTADKGSVRFEVTGLGDLPASDSVSIQFRTFDWFEPIPMWLIGENRWAFTLFGPLQFFDTIEYRFCRNDQCDIASDMDPTTENIAARQVEVSQSPKTLTDTLNWTYPPSSTTPTTIVALQVTNQGPSFFAGIELDDQFNPSHLPYFPISLDRVIDIGANWIILTPSWHYPKEAQAPMLASSLPGSDPANFDTIKMISNAKSRGLNVALFPRLLTFQSPEQWWRSQDLDSRWWDRWFDNYSRFLMHYAEIATKNDLPVLIIGGPEVLPALPDGSLPNSLTSSNPPDNVAARWDQLLEDLRRAYSGQIIWAIPSESIENAPSFLNNVDQIYVLVSEPLATEPEPDQDALIRAAGELLDTKVYPLFEKFQRPIFLGINYPSVKDASMGCNNPEDACQYFDYSEPVDVDEQANIYTGFLASLNNRLWIDGFVARGYFPSVAIQDKSASVNGKPASDILWYWFPRILAPGDENTN